MVYNPMVYNLMVYYYSGILLWYITMVYSCDTVDGRIIQTLIHRATPLTPNLNVSFLYMMVYYNGILQWYISMVYSCDTVDGQIIQTLIHI